MKTKNDWWFRFFNTKDYLDIYREMTGPQRTRQELGFGDKILSWNKGQIILDAPCGAGRHCFELARRGFYVFGLDISIYLLDIAKQRKKVSQGNNNTFPRFIRGLLQHSPFRSDTFDFVICMFSSFGYGETEEDNLIVLKEYLRVLKPGGKVLIDVMNRHFIIPRLNPIYESVQSGLRVREERTITDQNRRLHNLITVTDKNGDKRSYIYRPWLFNGWELSWLASRAGLKVENVYGNFQGDLYKSDSERAMLVAFKPMS